LTVNIAEGPAGRISVFSLDALNTINNDGSPSPRSLRYTRPPEGEIISLPAFFADANLISDFFRPKKSTTYAEMSRAESGEDPETGR
jgi:hypothetical protein